MPDDSSSQLPDERIGRPVSRRRRARRRAGKQSERYDASDYEVESTIKGDRVRPSDEAQRRELREQTAADAGEGFQPEDVTFSQGEDGLSASISESARKRELQEDILSEAGSDFSASDVTFSDTGEGMSASISGDASRRELREDVLAQAGEGFKPSDVTFSETDNGLSASIKKSARKRELREDVLSEVGEDFSASDVTFSDTEDGISASIKESAQRRELQEDVLSSANPDLAERFDAVSQARSAHEAGELSRQKLSDVINLAEEGELRGTPYSASDVAFNQTDDGLSASISDSAQKRELREDILSEAGEGFRPGDVTFSETDDGELSASISQDAQRRELREDILSEANPEVAQEYDSLSAVREGVMSGDLTLTDLHTAEQLAEQGDLQGTPYVGSDVTFSESDDGLSASITESAQRRELREDVLANAGEGFKPSDVTFSQTDDGLSASITESAQRRELQEDVLEQAGDGFSQRDITFSETEDGGLQASISTEAKKRELTEDVLSQVREQQAERDTIKGDIGPEDVEFSRNDEGVLTARFDEPFDGGGAVPGESGSESGGSETNENTSRVIPGGTENPFNDYPSQEDDGSSSTGDDSTAMATAKELRAAVAAATSGSGELARDVEATDAFPEQTAAVREQIESSNPGLEAGEDFNVSIGESGEFQSELTAEGREQVTERQQDLRAAAVAATSGSGELARGVTATDAFPEQTAAVRQHVESQSGLEAGEDFNVSINESGEFVVDTTEQYEQQQLEQANEGIAARARSEGIDVEKLEVQTGRDINQDGNVMSPQQYVQDEVRSQLESQSGVSLDDSDVTAIRTTVDGETVYHGGLTESGEQKLETNLETSSFTAKIPEGVPLVGGLSTTLKGKSREVTVESKNGEITTETNERFGDIDWSFGLGGPGDEVEQSAAAAGQAVLDWNREAADALFGGNGIASESAGQELLQAAGYPGLGAAYEQNLEQFGRKAALAPGMFGTMVTTTPFEAAEFASEAVTNPGGTAAKLPSAVAGTGATLATQTAKNPAGMAGSLVGTAALTRGLFTATQGTRLGTATRYAVQPGEELVKSVARRGAISTKTATKIPGVRTEQFESDTTGKIRETTSDISVEDLKTRLRINEFRDDSRGMAKLPKLGSDGESSSETSDAGSVTGSLSSEISDYLENFERGERIRSAKQRAEERFVEQQQERADLQERGDAPTTVDTRPGGDYTASSGPGGDYTASRSVDTSRSGPTAAQRRAYRSTITSSESSPDSESVREQAESSEVDQSIGVGLSAALLGESRSPFTEVGAESTSAQRAKQSLFSDVGSEVLTGYGDDPVEMSREETIPRLDVGATFGAITATAIGPDVEADIGTMAESGIEPRSRTRTGVETEPGIKTEIKGVETGLETGFEAGIETGVEVGVETEVETGIETGVETGAEAGVEVGGDPGREMSLDFGGESGGDDDRRFAFGVETAKLQYDLGADILDESSEGKVSESSLFDL